MFNPNRRQFEWPWKDILYFAASLVVIALALVVAVMLFIENDNLRKRIETNEDFIDTVPDLLEDLSKTLCDKIEALQRRLANEFIRLEDRISLLEELFAEGPFQQFSERGQLDGYCPLNGNVTVPRIHLPPNLMEASGCWDAMTNTPFLSSFGCNAGNFYVVSVAGNTTLNGINSWNLGDALVCVDGTFWKRIFCNC